MFNKLKNDFGFSPKIYTCNFNKASPKAVKSNFPNIYLVKCFFHFAMYLETFKKLGLTNRDNIKETTKLTYNIKMLCFVEQENIYIIYIKNYLKNTTILNIMIFFITLIEIGNLKVLIKKLNIFQNGIISIY